MSKKAKISRNESYKRNIIQIMEDSINDMNDIKRKIELQFDPKIDDLKTVYEQKIDKIKELNMELSELFIQKRYLKHKLKIFDKPLQVLTKKKNTIIKNKFRDLNSQKNFKIKKLNEDINYLENQLKILDLKKFVNKWKNWAHFKIESGELK